MELVMLITLVMEKQTQRQQKRRLWKYFYVFSLFKMSLQVTMHIAPGGGLQA
jgi:multisubunit Na+/H+ antiporter MnhB subunit